IVREFPDRLELPVARPIRRGGDADEALCGQRREVVDVGIRDSFKCFERAAAGEAGDPTKQLLLLGAEKVVAPGDRGLQGSLTLVGIARTAKLVQLLGKPLEQKQRR